MKKLSNVFVAYSIECGPCYMKEFRVDADKSKLEDIVKVFKQYISYNREQGRMNNPVTIKGISWDNEFGKNMEDCTHRTISGGCHNLLYSMSSLWVLKEPICI